MTHKEDTFSITLRASPKVSITSKSMILEILTKIHLYALRIITQFYLDKMIFGIASTSLIFNSGAVK